MQLKLLPLDFRVQSVAILNRTNQVAMNKEFKIGTSLDEAQENSSTSDEVQDNQETLTEDIESQKSTSEETESAEVETEVNESQFTPPPPPEPTTELQEEPKERSRKERSYTFVADPATDTLLRQIVEQHDCAKGVAVNRLLSHLYNVAEKKPEVKTEIVEKEVERPIGENQLLITLDPEEARLIDMIRAKRKEFAKSRNQEVDESRELLLKRSFFIKGRLFNHDNEFYTGLTRSDVK